MKFHHWALPRIPSSRDSIRKTDMCVPNFFVNWSLILRNQLFWYLTVRLVSENGQVSILMFCFRSQ
ncbi:hypothetical protein CFI14_12225 [Lactiplantibacillus pentosus]|nr:hypothetical protein CFK27_15070 [Lactiplantibacillus pentosus]AYG41828.1 hypothetical protein CFI14_12225 [Lactiplantibacillus pentosus]